MTIRKMTVVLMIAAFATVGCTTLAGIGRDVCDTVFGGSKVGGLCEKIEDLAAEEDEAPVE